ncbi:unnamed protein product [Closterium sp. NIES-53]
MGICTQQKLHQEKFIKELGEKYGIENERKVATPLPAEFKLVKAAEDEGVEAEEQQPFQSFVGSLLYAAVHTRPDISFSVGQLARVVQNPSEEQVDAAERVVKYLNSHPSIGVQYSASAQVKQKRVEVLKEKRERLGEGKLFLTCLGQPWFLCYKKPDGWTPQNRHQDGGAERNQKNGANMVADSSDNNPKSNGGAEKKKERTAGQFFHIGEQGEQGDASAKVRAELHPLDYWVLDTGAAWTMTPRKELLDDVRAAPINEVCSASGHALKVAGAGRAAFKGADGKPVVLHDVPDLKANLISLRKLAKAGVSTSTDGARTYKGQLGNRVLWDLHESKDVYRSMWQLAALA